MDWGAFIGAGARTGMELDQQKELKRRFDEQQRVQQEQWAAGNTRADAAEARLADEAARVKAIRDARASKFAALRGSEATIDKINSGAALTPDDLNSSLSAYNTHVKDGWYGSLAPDGSAVRWSKGSLAAVPTSVESLDQFKARAATPQARQAMYSAVINDLISSGDVEGAGLLMQQAQQNWGQVKDTHTMKNEDRREGRADKEFGYNWEDWNGIKGGLQGKKVSQTDFSNQTGRISAEATSRLSDAHVGDIAFNQGRTKTADDLATFLGNSINVDPRMSADSQARVQGAARAAGATLEGLRPGVNYDRLLYPETYARRGAGAGTTKLSEASFKELNDAMNGIHERLSSQSDPAKRSAYLALSPDDQMELQKRVLYQAYGGVDAKGVNPIQGGSDRSLPPPPGASPTKQAQHVGGAGASGLRQSGTGMYGNANNQISQYWKSALTPDAIKYGYNQYGEINYPR